MKEENIFNVSIEEVIRELECIKAVAQAKYTKECLQFAVDELKKIDLSNSPK